MDEDINRRRDCEQGLSSLEQYVVRFLRMRSAGQEQGGFEDIQPIIAAEGVGVAPPPRGGAGSSSLLSTKCVDDVLFVGQIVVRCHFRFRLCAACCGHGGHGYSSLRSAEEASQFCKD